MPLVPAVILTCRRGREVAGASSQGEAVVGCFIPEEVATFAWESAADGSVEEEELGARCTFLDA
jgi:hypothetical protein